MRTTFSPTSMYHLPQTIPYVKASNHEIQPTKYVLPLSIQIMKGKNVKSSFHTSCIVVGVFGAMKTVFDDTYLGPVEVDIGTPLIHQVNNVPLQLGNIKQYIATPIFTRPMAFIGKICIHSNHTIQEFRKSQELNKYFKKENIAIDIND
jgi:hypothetical protein